jgi:uncharacterized protein DUF6765
MRFPDEQGRAAQAVGYHRAEEEFVHRVSSLLFLGLLAAATSCGAFESDVHYGMTAWLALRAGFNERAAATIATGSQRVDSGDMQYTDVGLMYACLGKDDVGARRAGGHHYPTAGAVPGGPEARVVVAGSEAAMKAAVAMTKVPPDKSGFMLLKLGEALHILQESWAHQGVPDIPLGGKTGIDCDPTRAWGHPKARGGAGSHRADLTRYWPADTLAAAKATYDVLLQFAPVNGVKRTPQAWDEIRPRLDGFIKAATKTQKRDWFAAQGIADASFLEAISLPDGAKAFDLTWPGRRLPPVPTHQVRQHHVDPALLDFYHAFFERWMAARDFAALAAQFGPAAPARRAELAARLKLWRLRDHGRVADLAHTSRALRDEERARVDAVAGARHAFAAYESPLDAYFPLLPRIEGVSPLLPFFIAETSKDRIAVAAVKFRHAPYDAVAVLAVKTGRGWRVDSIVGTVDH